MKTDGSFYALLLTMVLVGALLFLLMLLKLPGIETQTIREYEVAYLDEPIEEKEAVEPTSIQKIETHRPFNEAKQFIESQEAQRAQGNTSFQDNISAMEQAIEKSKGLKSVEAKIVSNKEIKNNRGDATQTKESTLRNSTNSYRLVDRTVINFPNPVYVCEGFGKVVISIKVNDLGKVTDASFSQKLSTTTNECLIEVAINYTLKTTFNTKAGKKSQLGTITYQFPGQYY